MITTLVFDSAFRTRYLKNRAMKRLHVSTMQTIKRPWYDTMAPAWLKALCLKFMVCSHPTDLGQWWKWAWMRFTTIGIVYLRKIEKSQPNPVLLKKNFCSSFPHLLNKASDVRCVTSPLPDILLIPSPLIPMSFHCLKMSIAAPFIYKRVVRTIGMNAQAIFCSARHQSLSEN